MNDEPTSPVKVFPLGRWEVQIFKEFTDTFAGHVPKCMANALDGLRKEDPNVSELSPDVWDHTSALGIELEAFAEVRIFQLPSDVVHMNLSQEMVKETLGRLDWFLVAEALMRNLEVAEF